MGSLEYIKKWRAEHPELVAATRQRYRQSQKGKHTSMKYKQSWKKKNPEKQTEMEHRAYFRVACCVGKEPSCLGRGIFIFMASGKESKAHTIAWEFRVELHVQRDAPHCRV